LTGTESKKEIIILINGLSASPPHLKGTMKENFKLGQKRCAGGFGCGPVGKTHKFKFYPIA
jgi:hypothetical protein